MNVIINNITVRKHCQDTLPRLPIFLSCRYVDYFIIECSYYFGNIKVKVTYGRVVVHISYIECSNQYVIALKMKVIATSLALVITLAVLATIDMQPTFAGTKSDPKGNNPNKVNAVLATIAGNVTIHTQPTFAGNKPSVTKGSEYYLLIVKIPSSFLRSFEGTSEANETYIDVINETLPQSKALQNTTVNQALKNLTLYVIDHNSTLEKIGHALHCCNVHGVIPGKYIYICKKTCSATYSIWRRIANDEPVMFIKSKSWIYYFQFHIKQNQGDHVIVCVYSKLSRDKSCLSASTTGGTIHIQFPDDNEFLKTQPEPLPFNGPQGVDAQASYRLTVNVPSHLFGNATVLIGIHTANGYTDNEIASTADGVSYTFTIPKNQGNSVQVCVNSGTLFRCLTYMTNGGDMSVPLSSFSLNGLSGTQAPYRLTVTVPAHLFGYPTVDISVVTENGYVENQEYVPTAGGASYTFNIPPNQGNSVQVCVSISAGNLKHCVTYKTNGKNKSVQLSTFSGSGHGGKQLPYRLTVNVPTHPFGALTVGISIATKNGYTEEENVPTAGGAAYTFNIPPNQGNSVQVCVNFSPNCQKYETNGRDKSVSFTEPMAGR
jgi:hypothetical protein